MADPTAAPADPSADPSAEAADPSAGGGYTIEISVMADGKISVGCESASEENAEESGGGEASEAGGEPSGEAQPCKGIKDALIMALEIFKNNGEMPAPDDSDEQFASGYGGSGE